MGDVCSKAHNAACVGGCGFSCQCMTCQGRMHCDCSCRWIVVFGIALTVISIWIAVLSLLEKRRWLFTWSGIYALIAMFMTITTHLKGPDPHDVFGCSVPFSLWVGCLFVATLSYYTSDYMRRGAENEVERAERYVYDPAKGEYVLARKTTEVHAR
eukprot:jgi/Botrbrau1/8936/Bobra.0148s0049.1